MTIGPTAWDEQASTFDDEPDHGLRDPTVRSAWAGLLLPLLPAIGSTILDLGCGTGSLSVLLALAGYDVRGLDLSREMITRARTKALDAHVSVLFEQGDAGEPAYSTACADVVLVRHVLWALPDKEAAVSRWTGLLKPGGILLLVEGLWWTGGGVRSDECERIVRTCRKHADLSHLDDPALWGGPVADERYLLVSRY